MLRKIVAAVLLVSLVAMATSGVLMLAVGRPSFTMQMHPVHKLFGILMMVAAVTHIVLNRRALLACLRVRQVALVFGAGAALLVLLYGVAANNSLPDEAAAAMDRAVGQVERRVP